MGPTPNVRPWSSRVVWRREEKWVSGQDGGRVVILDTRAGAYLTLNETGGVLWQAIGVPIAVGDLVAQLAGRYAVAGDDVGTTVAGFLDDLETRGLLKWRSLGPGDET